MGIITVQDVDISSGDGGYVRWRPRMVRLSVFEDMKNTLTSTGWMTASLKYPFAIKEFFPEFAVFKDDATHINTLAVDSAEPLVLEEYELGLQFARLYRVNMAFYAQDDETGVAIFSDLADRYDGLTDAPYISLFDYNQGANPPLITRMEVASFQYTRAAMDVAPYENHLWFGELMVRDFIDSDRSTMPS
ncbi:MAG TPA: hypothetical protein VFH56_02685 [Acidimicrobiales bacterium]|nr:hypothetical protein [Acidimicrobiales bacterium]